VVWRACRSDGKDSRRLESAFDCRVDPMADHWPLFVAEPLDGERLVIVNFALAWAQSQLVGTTQLIVPGFRGVVLYPTSP